MAIRSANVCGRWHGEPAVPASGRRDIDHVAVGVSGRQASGLANAGGPGGLAALNTIDDGRATVISGPSAFRQSFRRSLTQWKYSGESRCRESSPRHCDRGRDQAQLPPRSATDVYRPGLTFRGNRGSEL